MLKLKSIKFNNIGRFVTEQTVDFQNLRNLVQVDAQNLITNGSSGSGKSTLFNAIDFLFGVSDLPTTVLQSRLTKDHIEVTIDVDWDGKQVRIRRAKKLVIDVDGQETSGASKIVEEKLDEIIGMPRHLFRLMLHRRQGESGFFLGLGPSKTFEFLTDVLGLSLIRSKIDVIDQKSKDLLSLKTTAQSALDSAGAALKATEDAIQALGPEPVTDVTEETLEFSESQHEIVLNALSSIKIRHELEKNELNEKKPKLDSMPFNRFDLELIESSIKSIQDKINEILDLDRTRQIEINKEISHVKQEAETAVSTLKLENSEKLSKLKSRITELDYIVKVSNASKEEALKIAGQVKTLRSGLCQTCEQSWITKKAKDEEQRLLQGLAKHKSNIDAGNNAESEKKKLEDSCNELNENLNTRRLEILENLSAKLDGLKEKLDSKENDLDLQNFNSKLKNARENKLREQEKEAEHNQIQNSANKKIMESFFTAQQELSKKHEKEVKDIQEDVETKRSANERLRSQFRTYQVLVRDHNKNTEALMVKKDEYTSKVGHMTLKLEELSLQVNVAEEVKRCLKSYLSCSFDDALDSVSDTATRILRSVPTMANSTIRLEGTKETAAGAIKEQITALLDSNGEIDVPIKSLSGGERSAVDMALDLAVCQMIQEKANKGIDFLALDEIFNGFDSIGIEQALEMLKNFASDKRIFIVEHDGIAKEFVQDRITVVRDGESSYIKSA